jgi:hypothetical protein
MLDAEPRIQNALLPPNYQMKHSMAVPVRNNLFLYAMADFLADNYRPWADIVDGAGKAQFHGPTDELVENPAKCRIGFNYTLAHGPEREYVMALLRWIASKVGRRCRKFKMGRLYEPFPYLYEGHESQPVLPEETPLPKAFRRSFQPYVVNQFGIPISKRIERDLAWFCLPEGTFTIVSALYLDRSVREIQEGIIQRGMSQARLMLNYIQAEIGRLDAFWTQC